MGSAKRERRGKKEDESERRGEGRDVVDGETDGGRVEKEGVCRLTCAPPNPPRLPVGQKRQTPQLPETLGLNGVLWLRPPANISMDFK